MLKNRIILWVVLVLLLSAWPLFPSKYSSSSDDPQICFGQGKAAVFENVFERETLERGVSDSFCPSLSCFLFDGRYDWEALHIVLLGCVSAIFLPSASEYNRPLRI